MSTGTELSENLNTVVKMMRSQFSYQDAIREFKKALLLQILRASGNNQCTAANAIGVHRNTLAREIRALGIDPKQLSHKKFATRKVPQ